jgi:tetratricopeptide (TPR) repeat protein
MPDILQQSWKGRPRNEQEEREQTLAASRECMANGNRYCLMERYPAALREYTKALQLDDSNLEAALEVGRVAWHLANREEAGKGWKKAIMIDPLAASAHAGLFTMLQSGSEEERRRAFRHAITLRVLSPYRTSAKEFIALNPAIALEIKRVGDDAEPPGEEMAPRELLATAWKALPKHDTRTADACFARVLATLDAQDAQSL